MRRLSLALVLAPGIAVACGNTLGSDEDAPAGGGDASVVEAGGQIDGGADGDAASPAFCEGKTFAACEDFEPGLAPRGFTQSKPLTTMASDRGGTAARVQSVDGSAPAYDLVTNVSSGTNHVHAELVAKLDPTSTGLVTIARVTLLETTTKRTLQVSVVADPSAGARIDVCAPSPGDSGSPCLYPSVTQALFQWTAVSIDVTTGGHFDIAIDGTHVIKDLGSIASTGSGTVEIGEVSVVGGDFGLWFDDALVKVE